MEILTQSLASLATQVPGATRIFHHYKLDFCCGGQRTLGDALKKREQDPAPVVAELVQLMNTASPEPQWQQASNPELVAHVFENFHQKHRQQLPELIRLARRVEHVHGDSDDCPHGLADHLEAMYQELENHMQKEEQILFPMLVRDIFPSGPISVMEEEHLEHGQALEKMQALARNLELPPGACNTWTALYVGLKELKEDLMEHIHLENNILFVNRTEGEGSCCGSCH
ncbi:iron-sulfur cluster repair protein YtfE [Lacimicrobium alkaliphilum]|uniref:Iron-sulfur cluster repair di-iron protein n=1 Tax=Lacimicrobium alkaliphilum TaxID=1526571 RepID=A0A0U2PFE4_9ALTE|nr:iron-sulfur cluster repair protein YtfE [Lacimicrobium alkaliphilum]ALS98045.1 iron-sulfur cluster repair di-iron protein [Lacimicrobium alkaliphilum]